MRQQGLNSRQRTLAGWAALPRWIICATFGLQTGEETQGNVNPTPLPDAQATQAYGRRLAGELLASGAAGGVVVLLLQGPLGAGKTCLVGGLALALAIGEPITSPTFALAQHYRGQWRNQSRILVHLDLYRLEQPGIADQLFWEEEELAHDQGALLAVEWPERLSQWPQGAWHLQLRMADQGRLAVLSGPVFPP